MVNNKPLYPNVQVRLVGQDGNAFFMVMRVADAMKGAGIKQNVIEKFQEDALSGDYNHVLETIMRYVVVV